MAINLLVSSSNDPRLNLAIEEYLTFSYPSKELILFFWRNDNTIVVGRNQNTFAEVNVLETWKDHVQVVRRNTGGGAVYHDLGNVNFSIIVNNDREVLDYQAALEPVIRFLNQSGVEAVFSGRNDIVVNGFKVSGNAQLKTKTRTLVHGTLMFDVNLEKLKKYLIVNQEKLQHQKVKSKVSRVKNLHQLYLEAGVNWDVNEFFNQLIDFYRKDNEVNEIVFTPEQWQQIETLKETKYDSWDWNFGKNSDYEVSKSAYLEQKGYLQINSTVDQGIIKKFKIYGDFLGTKGTEELETNFIGKKLDQEVLSKTLDEIAIDQIFGPNFTKEDILNILFR